MQFVPISVVLYGMTFGNSVGMTHDVARDFNPGKNVMSLSVSAVGPVHIRKIDFLFNPPAGGQVYTNPPAGGSAKLILKVVLIVTPVV
jgi:hypothetical protein